MIWKFAHTYIIVQAMIFKSALFFLWKFWMYKWSLKMNWWNVVIVYDLLKMECIIFCLCLECVRWSLILDFLYINNRLVTMIANFNPEKYYDNSKSFRKMSTRPSNPHLVQATSCLFVSNYKNGYPLLNWMSFKKWK